MTAADTDWLTFGEQLIEPLVRTGPVDTCLFLGAWPFRLTAHAAISDLSAYADLLGLTGGYVGHLASVFGRSTREGNEELLAQTRTDDRLHAVAVLDPTSHGWEAELSWSVSAGARGVRLVPGYHGYQLDDPRVADLIAAVGVPLFVTVRLEDSRIRHPRYRVEEPTAAQVAELLRAVPTGRPIVLSGLNLADWRAIEAHLDAGHDLTDVIADLWFVNGPFPAMATICADGLADRFCFGTNAPIQTPIATAVQLGAADVVDADRLRLARGNAERVLGH